MVFLIVEELSAINIQFTQKLSASYAHKTKGLVRNDNREKYHFHPSIVTRHAI